MAQTHIAKFPERLNVVKVAAASSESAKQTVFGAARFNNSVNSLSLVD